MQRAQGAKKQPLAFSPGTWPPSTCPRDKPSDVQLWGHCYANMHTRYIRMFSFWPSRMALGSSKGAPRQWKHRVLTTGPSAKSPYAFFEWLIPHTLFYKAVCFASPIQSDHLSTLILSSVQFFSLGLQHLKQHPAHRRHSVHIHWPNDRKNSYQNSQHLLRSQLCHQPSWWT